MTKTRTIAAAALLAATASSTAVAAQDRPAPHFDPSKVVKYDATYTLESNTSKEYRLPVEALGQDWNTVLPCQGIEISGPGIDLAAQTFEYFGVVEPEPAAANTPNGGIPGAVKQPDGTFVRPESEAKLNAESLRFGASCKAVGWDFVGADGKPTLDPYGNPYPASGKARTAKASRALKAKRLKTAKKKVKGRAAQSGPVTVTLVGTTRARGDSMDLVVRVSTGQLTGRTTLAMHSRVLRQTPSAQQ
ncbi:hypothetical protein [Conexibacter sp. SYSU D00693]|uniref:hypothetical protein n=1 Tax=Conexibacter sp. SYSU D00693 TaxID=2812560 RepID=UPI00196A9E55|nr:hypothetical protein [Conexibacter sp. SYSU D00693]